ncbi:Os04g0389600 [Oryza sativa Japonica Group]|uniref:OSJNBa0053B21.12 protein n=4 Tax=Oryza TaxID=4527 RepID=B7EKP1_ORYSJ|nr:Os04g0389600 [Oryza sativa Japonica Group]BAG92938.1 unnamed protein product [Oryza sativa Japonica Group]CAE05538.2 OSJNBa0053B21.12 [Oryza sativa Japonica Group]|eukprot:NP_001052636.1 Os04g0389600 [Oryza sativa Japonica Group]
MGRPPCCDKVGVKRGAMDAGGGPDAGLLHPGARRRQLARRADQHRADALQQELPAPVDELPPAGDQAGELHRAGGEAHRPPPGSPRQPFSTIIVVHNIAMLSEYFQWIINEALHYKFLQ